MLSLLLSIITTIILLVSMIIGYLIGASKENRHYTIDGKSIDTADLTLIFKSFTYKDVDTRYLESWNNSYKDKGWKLEELMPPDPDFDVKKERAIHYKDNLESTEEGPEPNIDGIKTVIYHHLWKHLTYKLGDGDKRDILVNSIVDKIRKFKKEEEQIN